MAIVKMSKFNLIILSNDRNKLLDPLQDFKYVHFLNLHENKTLKAMDLAEIDVEDTLTSIEEEIRKVSFSIDQLWEYDTRKKGLHQLKEGIETLDLTQLEEKAESINYLTIYEQIKEIREKKENIERKIKQKNEKMDELKPWIPLDVPIEWLSSLQHCQINIGAIPKKLTERLEQELTTTNFTYYKKISEDNQNTYIILITYENEQKASRKILLNNGFSKIKLDGYSKKPVDEIASLTKEREELKVEWQMLENRMKAVSEQLDDLELMYDHFMMKKTRISASEKFLSTDLCTILEGYIPTKFVNKFEKIVKKQLGNHYYLQVEQAKENDPNVPILLDNHKFFRVFESVTEMYALPKYNEIDPTPWFTIFYALFFGMMIGDAGYGLLMLVGTYAALKLFKLTSKQRSFIQFFYYLSFSTILWGAIYGSFFGDMFALPSLINATEEYNLLLILSIALGGIHIFFALAIQGYMDIRKGKLLDALFDVGFWYMAIGGGIVYLLALFLPISQNYEKTGLIVMLIGMVGILLTGGRDSQGIGAKIAGGLYSLYGITSYVGDFVSYSRLMALGLASAFIAYAVNLMVRMLFDLGIIGVIVGIIVFVVGQGFNIFLSILSSYVHTLRLTYVEFFGKFYEGGGKAFQPFRSESKYIEIK